ncbi:MAG: RsmD family RNA methyltransferase, partial [Bacteroidota bacterium]|nr:RsmD family RNA methyltransferase [Bacteroidota bacterium]
MRIVSGKFRGKIIVAPKNLPVRPTTDMAKESLFNILNNYYHFDQVEVLDLFAGTGNIT